jgi:uncharacterized protein YggE
MLKPRTILIALSALLAGAALSGLGIAQADDPTATTPATIVVNGTDTITLDPSASDATQQATYQTALGGALTDANQKASFIAGQVSATLGAITNVTETSDSSDLCQGSIVYPAATAKPAKPAPAPSKHKATAIRFVPIGVSTQCSIEADVTVTYDMTPS